MREISRSVGEQCLEEFWLQRMIIALGKIVTGQRSVVLNRIVHVEGVKVDG